MTVGTVEKIISGGWGIIRENSKVIFLSHVLPGEKVSYRIKEKAKGIYWGELLGIIEAAPERIEAPCHYYGTCGGCVFQHMEYSTQKQLKQTIFQAEMKRIGKQDVHIDHYYESPPFQYRIRGRLKGHQSGRVGFIRKGTHHVYPIDHCLLFTEEMNHFLAQWNNLDSPPFFFQQDILNNPWSGDLLSYLSHPPTAAQEKIISVIPSIHFSWKNNDDRALNYPVKKVEYQVKGSTFFQVNRHQHSHMLDFVEANLFHGKQAIDLYSGVGFFIPLLDRYFDQVTAVENHKESVSLARKSFPESDFIESSVDRFSFYPADLVILDPPRSGLSKYVMKNLLQFKYHRLIYISCSTATFARDSKHLIENGYTLDQLALIDLFPQTSHIEVMSVFTRSTS